MSHEEYLSDCSEDQTQRLMEMCKAKLDAINAEGWKKDIVALNPVLVKGLVQYYFEMWKKLAEV